MVERKSQEDIRRIAKAGRVVAECHRAIASRIAPGVTTLEIDRFVERLMRERGATPAQKGYRGYPFATCASVNDVVCHGFPDAEPLEEGDIVTIDMVADVDGWKADSAWTFPIGRASTRAKRLLRATRNALDRAIAQAVPGKRLGDIGHAVKKSAEESGFAVVTGFVGHGIGRDIHESPAVENKGREGKGIMLKPGMVITIEPILTTGSSEVSIGQDGWSARTRDGSLAAMFEHTIAITEKGPLILTDW
ncbi:methionine aminopeptidase, type I [Paenibacillus curdlanolyticus YK9]|uniref:Methionine aminopeptidase n=1 Tax=Paenibacillus curdlanolyticus YK9 TaxID=717606 RepID=E0IB31_9BACL|nr:type I methionyl aminopeptidase [Paenibacillus curdlanolyticus]EFM10322.1 methionine aminopeptidase, type I [Paenibacillus curdlanolyticus YK9]